MKKNILTYLVNKKISIEEACNTLNLNAKKNLIIIDSKKKILGLVNDGDIRRALISGFSIKDKIYRVMNKNPYVVKYKKIKDISLNFFKEKNIDILPVVKDGKIFDVFTKEQFSKEKYSNQSVIINTGGKGVRLRPFTSNKNKIMVKVSKKKNIGDLLLEKFIKQGFTNFVFLTNFKSIDVKKYFSKKFSEFDLNFLKEKKPLGTCGPLSQLEMNNISNTFIFINCDVVSNINYNNLIDFHIYNKSDLTIVSAQKTLKLDYGNINFNGLDFNSIDEKPEVIFTVNAGIYVINKKILKFIKKNKKIDMPDFIKTLNSGDNTIKLEQGFIDKIEVVSINDDATLSNWQGTTNDNMKEFFSVSKVYLLIF